QRTGGEVDLESADGARARIEHVEKTVEAFRGDRQIVGSGTARGSPVEQSHGAVISHRIAGDARTEIVSDVCELAGYPLDRDAARRGPSIKDMRADRLQTAVADDRERRQR